MSLGKIRSMLDELFDRERLQGVKVTAVRGKDEIVLFMAYCNPINGYALIPKGYDLLLEPIYARKSQHSTTQP